MQGGSSFYLQKLSYGDFTTRARVIKIHTKQSSHSTKSRIGTQKKKKQSGRGADAGGEEFPTTNESPKKLLSIDSRFKIQRKKNKQNFLETIVEKDLTLVRHRIISYRKKITCEKRARAHHDDQNEGKRRKKGR
jgi:hypothetical protein